MNRSARRLSIAAVIVAAAIVLSGCTSLFLPQKTTSTPTNESVPADLAPYYHQTLKWTPCNGAFQCSTATVPLDWSKPSGSTIHLALIRHLATGHKLGSLLVNPGGPGASGFDFVRDSLNFAVDKTLQANYDIVGFDPRGDNHSSAVKCYTNPKTLDAFIFDIPKGVMGSDEWIANEEKEVKAFGADCLHYTGALLGQVDTVSAARDLDVLRAALGDKKLNYLGYSYGTLLGQTYANLYPKKTGRLVLDGVVDPQVSADQLTEYQAKGFEDELQKFVEECPTMSGCPFTGSVASSMAEIGSLLDSLDKSPLRNKDGRELGAETMFTAIITPLYNVDNWPALVDLFTTVMHGDPSYAFQIADQYYERNSTTGKYTDNSYEAFNAINCLDYPSNTNIAYMRAEAVKIDKVAPVIGHLMAYGDVFCDGWPFKAAEKPGPLPAVGSAPILVIGTTGDPATPYVMAQHVATVLQNGRLVTYHGDGHTAYNKGTATAAERCVNSTVDNFFVKDTVPKTDVDCK
ncbi:MAG: alpha/beta hydrolase [Glaciihabitans sp.]|nr:alpha/beta hydrolase [Glaciihabitans sp.]